MAVVSTPNGSRLQISYVTGKDSRGVDVVRSRTYNYIKNGAVDQDVMDVATVLNSLQSNPVKKITRINEIELTQG